jgi:hypothetical protein
MKKARSFYEQFLARAGGEERYKPAVEDVKRRCKLVKGQRRPNDKCISGRFQNIEEYLMALKDMAEMERLQKEAEKQQAELEAEEKKQQAAQPPPPPAEGAAPAGAPPVEGQPAEGGAEKGGDKKPGKKK